MVTGGLKGEILQIIKENDFFSKGDFKEELNVKRVKYFLKRGDPIWVSGGLN